MIHAKRAQQFMGDTDLDVLVATSPANVTYFSGYQCWLDPLFKEYMMVPGGSNDLVHNYALFTRDGRTALVLDASMMGSAVSLEVDELFPAGDFGVLASDSNLPMSSGEARIYERISKTQPSAVEGLASALRSLGLEDGRIGLDLEALTSKETSAIRAQCPRSQIRNASNLIRIIRMVKTNQEITTMRQATAIAEQAAHEAFSQLKPGRALSTVDTVFREALARQGADVDHMTISPRGLGISCNLHGEFREDDICYVDYGCIYQNYFSDAGFTAAGTKLSGHMLDCYEAIRDAVKASKDEMRPGVKSSRVAQVLADVMAERGFTKVFPHGHGLGLELRDYPILVPDTGLRIKDECIDLPSDLPLESGMVINVENGLFMPPQASFQIEQTFLVTTHGCDLLTEEDRSEAVICR